jgi:hypothetical protein
MSSVNSVVAAYLMVILLILSVISGSAQPSGGNFIKHVITTEFISEGVTTGDVNQDGKTDILAGGFWFEAPDFKRHEITSPEHFDPDKDYSHSFLNAAADINQDGWIDLLQVDFPGTSAYWYENPKHNDTNWKRHLIYETVSNESPAFTDVDGDGKIDLLCADPKDKQIIYLTIPSDFYKPWDKHLISKKKSPGTEIFSHGLGIGDLNNDGRRDVIIREGWWEAPDKKDIKWKFHQADLGDECSQMYTLDVNQDGLMDVISASAHLSGIWWHEQLINGWQQHVISYAFAESHALILMDVNGDGAPDIISGKRNLKRNTWRNNPGTDGPPLLFWYEFTPGRAPFWIAHQIDDGSGAGLNIATADLNQDGNMDFAVANFKGVFWFENKSSKPHQIP